MNPSNPSFRKEYECTRCKHKGVLRLKMGGLICDNCRVILFFPDTPEWKEEFRLAKNNGVQMNLKEQLEKYKKREKSLKRS